MKYIAKLCLLLALPVMLWTCEKDGDDPVGTYMNLGQTVEDGGGVKHDELVGEDYRWSAPRTVSTRDFFLFTDYGSWQVIPVYTVEEGEEGEEAVEQDWIEIWPSSGSADGRFYVKLHENTTGETRSAEIHVVSGGQVPVVIPVAQLP